MSSTYKTISVFLSGYSIISGYQCPSDKTALVKQISYVNETQNSGIVDVKWEDNGFVGIGSTMIGSKVYFPISVSGVSQPFGTSKILEDFIAIGPLDLLTFRTPTTGRVNVLITVIEQDLN